MQRIQRFGMSFALVIGALLVFTGCAQKSPLETMIENRSRYTAEINGFYVDANPLVADAGAGEVEGEGEGEPEGEPEGEGELVEPEPVELVQIAHLDILIKHDSFEKLAGVTVDIIQVDPDENEKGRWLVWFDTANVERANPTQYSHEIEGIDYVEGDGFTVEVRHPIPEGERGDYQEFANVGS